MLDTVPLFLFPYTGALGTAGLLITGEDFGASGTSGLLTAGGVDLGASGTTGLELGLSP